MRAVDYAAFTAGLLADLTEECGWEFVMSAETELFMGYASSVVKAGGKE